MTNGYHNSLQPCLSSHGESEQEDKRQVGLHLPVKHAQTQDRASTVSYFIVRTSYGDLCSTTYAGRTGTTGGRLLYMVAVEFTCPAEAVLNWVLARSCP